MIMILWEKLVDWVLSLGYLGMFAALVVEGIGLPFPGDAALAFFGYLTSTGKLLLPVAILAASLGSTLGSVLAFALGKRYGFGLLSRYGKYLLLSPRSISRTLRLSTRYGVLVLLFGRMLPGVRSLSSYIAGIGGLSWSVFMLYSFAGFVLFCGFWLSIGFLLGENWSTIVYIVQDYLLGLTILVILVSMIVLLWKVLRRE